MNFLAFDLETARVIADGNLDGVGWAAHRPLGISCYALAWRDGPYSTGPLPEHDAAIRRHR